VKCSICQAEFIPKHKNQTTCLDPICKLEAKRQEGIKRNARQDLSKRRQALKSKSDWAKEAQTVFNAYIRARDEVEPCISCSRYHQGQYHAGHYLSVGARPELRFNPLNVHKQCAPCNNHLSGNIALFRINLIKKIGLEQVEWLEGPHEPSKYTIEDLKTIRETYRLKLKSLLQSLN
jgi:hypothetical protein